MFWRTAQATVMYLCALTVSSLLVLSVSVSLHSRSSLLLLIFVCVCVCVCVCVFQAMFDFRGNSKTELNLKKGEVIYQYYACCQL